MIPRFRASYIHHCWPQHCWPRHCWPRHCWPQHCWQRCAQEQFREWRPKFSFQGHPKVSQLTLLPNNLAGMRRIWYEEDLVRQEWGKRKGFVGQSINWIGGIIKCRVLRYDHGVHWSYTTGKPYPSAWMDITIGCTWRLRKFALALGQGKECKES